MTQSMPQNTPPLSNPTNNKPTTRKRKAIPIVDPTTEKPINPNDSDEETNPPSSEQSDTAETQTEVNTKVEETQPSPEPALEAKSSDGDKEPVAEEEQETKVETETETSAGEAEAEAERETASNDAVNQGANKEEPPQEETETVDDVVPISDTQEPCGDHAQEEESSENEPKEEEVEDSEGDGSVDEGDEDEDEDEDEEKEPITPKIRLSREEIMRLRNASLSCKPPDGLHGLEIFHDPSKPRVATNKREKSTPRGRRGHGKSPAGRSRRGGRDRRSARSAQPAKRPEKKEWQLVKSEDEEIIKKARLIVNKITPEKYDKLKTKLLDLDLSSPTRLQGVISIIYELAVNVQNYCEMYANLCRDVSMSEAELAKEFRKMLITLCQKEFEHAPTVDDSLSPEEKEEQAFVVKKRMMGNMKFIGELYKQRMLSEKIMHTVIETLFQTENRDESYEQLTILLTKIGKDLDTQSPSVMGSYFKKLQKAQFDKSLSFRTRCLVMDTMDLRAANWVPRREEVQAKKIKDIHSEVKQKQTPKSRSRDNRDNRSGRSSNRSSPVFKDRRGGTPSGRKSGSNTPRSRSRDVRGGTGSGGNAWSRATGGSSRGGAAAARSDNRDVLPTNNSFGALDLRPNAGRKEKRAPSTPSPEPVPDKTSPLPSSPTAPAEVSLSSEQVILKSNNLIEEYAKMRDKDEAAITFKELGSDNFCQFCEVYLRKITEASPAACEPLFVVSEIFSENGITSDHVIEGARKVVQTAIDQDLYFDVPQLFTNLGAACGVLTNQQLLSFERVQKHVLGMENMESDYISDIFFGFLSKVKSTSSVSEQIRSSSINLFENINPLSGAFGKKLELLSRNKVDLSLDVSLFVYDAVKKDKESSEIEAWLDAIPCHTEPWFACKVALAILAASCKQGSADYDAIKSRVPLLQRFAKSVQHQVMVLKGVAIIFEHQRKPSGMGKELYEALSDVVSPDAMVQFKETHRDSAKLINDIEG